MKYYIATDGKLTTFDKAPSIFEYFKIQKKYVNKQSITNMQSFVMDMASNSNVLYLHPDYQPTLDTIRDTVFDYASLYSEDMLISELQKNTTNDFYIIGGVVYETYGAFIRIFTINEEDYNRFVRFHIIDTFLENN